MIAYWFLKPGKWWHNKFSEIQPVDNHSFGIEVLNNISIHNIYVFQGIHSMIIMYFKEYDP